VLGCTEQRGSQNMSETHWVADEHGRFVPIETTVLSV
jgi:hypothetical protein